MTTLAANEPKPRPPKVKKLYLINRDFQLRYTKIAVIVGLCSTALTLFLVLFPLFQFRIIRFPDFLPTPFLLAILLAALLNFAIVATMGILVTHRIAGPMFSLVRQFRILQTGRLDAHLRIREGDDLKYVVRNFNEMVDGLADGVKKDVTNLDFLVQSIESLNHPSAKDIATVAKRFRADLADRLGKTQGEQP